MIISQYKKLNNINLIRNLIKTVVMDSAKRDYPGKSIQATPQPQRQ
jgi:hypothetical protein